MIFLNQSISKLYAQAFFNVFGNRVTENDCLNFEKISDFIQSKNISVFLINFGSGNLKIELSMMDQLKKYLNLNEDIIKLISLLITHRKMILLPLILLEIEKLYKKSKNICKIEITSSYKLSFNQKEEIELFLSRKTLMTNICSYSVDQDLIAGLKLKSNEFMWEHSIKKCIKTIRLAITQ